MPALGLFALGQRRFPAAVAATTHIVLLGVLIGPKRHCKQIFLGERSDTHRW